MNISIKIYFFLLLIVIAACTSKTPTRQSDQVETQEEIDSISTEQPINTQDLKGNIKDILLSYYQDLSNERLSEEKYFANNLEYFFGKTDVPREEVAQSIKNGFSEIEDRIIQLDLASLTVTPLNDEIVAEFSGQVQFKRTKEQTVVNESFYNRVTFNQELQIVRYESLDSQQATERTSPQNLRESSDPSNAVKDFLAAWKKGDTEKIQSYIYAQTGFYYITRPGAMDAIYSGQAFDEVFEKAYTSWTPELLRNASCDPQLEDLPEYDCESFSKTGCFIASVDDYQRVSYLMKVLKENDLGKFPVNEIDKAREIEAYISHQVLITNSAMSMCWGKINDQWYILVLDIASYDCSA